MWKWQVKVKHGHFFGEHKLWGSKFFAYAHISWGYLIWHIFEKISVTPSGKFALILTNTPVKKIMCTWVSLEKMPWSELSNCGTGTAIFWGRKSDDARPYLMMVHLTKIYNFWIPWWYDLWKFGFLIFQADSYFLTRLYSKLHCAEG